MEINKDFLNENRQRLVTQSLQLQGSQPPSLVLGGDSTAGKGVGKLKAEKSGRLQEYSNWRLLAWGSWRREG